jgi:hypothetical protein
LWINLDGMRHQTRKTIYESNLSEIAWSTSSHLNA